MSQSVWHKHDIENVLRGVELSCRQMAAQFDDPETESYRRGFQAALAATATSFGIKIDQSPLWSAPNEASWSVSAGRPATLLAPHHGPPAGRPGS
ncbi:MAG TPA: hypothetical protein PKM78_05675 [Anaerolineae bacterium]|nr:hypothetical protein [Anaerolineae bacterium]HNU03315.1 hypothetical protein [Anaerolineae bacterium]